MNKNIFDLCLSFHNELIRASLSQVTIDNTEKLLVQGDERLSGVGAQNRYKANEFARTMKARYELLVNWHGSDGNEKRDLYKSSLTRFPADGVFDAVALVIAEGLKIGTAAASCGVNFQSVKVLMPRIERYNKYAQKLNQLTNP